MTLEELAEEYPSQVKGSDPITDPCRLLPFETERRVAYPNVSREASHVILVEDEESGKMVYKRLFGDGRLGNVEDTDSHIGAVED